MSMAQNTMNIYQSNGSVLQIPINSIDSITYTLINPGNFASLSTLTLSNISANTATSGGNITNDGGSSVTQRGVCWGTSQNPTTANSTTSDGNGIGNYSSNLTGLTASTTYYVRAYAINSAGTAYGNQVSFNTSSSGGNQPTVVTNTITNITGTSANVASDVTSDGGETILARGACWSTSPNPTTSNSTTSDGGTVGAFSSAITGLQLNTTYYVRAYATNIYGTAYGAQLSFITLNLPVLSTTSVSGITHLSAVGGGNVSSDGGSPVTQRGVCWSTTSGPTVLDSVAVNGTGLGSFASAIQYLSANSTYYVRSYATSSVGTAYGNEVVFITLPAFTAGSGVSDIEGYTYASIVLSNGQEWMAENLRVAAYANGDPIPNVTADLAWEALSTGAYCWYDNQSTYETISGKLYNWYAVSDSRDVCPIGWHVPTDAEWYSFESYLDPTINDPNATGSRGFYGAAKMKSAINWDGTNESGFSAVPGGHRLINSQVGLGFGFSNNAFWWTSSIAPNNFSWARSIGPNAGEEGVGRGYESRGVGYSVRCLKD